MISAINRLLWLYVQLECGPANDRPPLRANAALTVSNI